MIVEIVEVGNIKYFTTPFEPDAWDLFLALRKAGFNPQIVRLYGDDSAIKLD